MPWKKGESGNPKGRPRRGQTMTAALRKYLRAKDDDGKSNRELVAEALVEAAISGNVAAIKEVYERLDGKVEQEQELFGKDGGPVTVRFVFDAEGPEGIGDDDSNRNQS